MGSQGSNIFSDSDQTVQTDFNTACTHMPTCTLCGKVDTSSYNAFPRFLQKLFLQIQIHHPLVKINKIFEHKIANIFLPISFNVCFGCSKEPSH